MSDKLISELVEKTGVVDSDQLPVEGSGGTWKITLLKLREYIFGIFPLFLGSTSKNDFLIVKKFEDGSVYRVSLDSALPDAVVKTKHLEDSVSASTGIVESKIAPAAVTHSKLAIDSVHTHNIANAEATLEIRKAEAVAGSEKGKKKAMADQRIYVQAQEAEAV